MRELPTGTVTFLLTDVESSTRLWERHPAAMRVALARHDALIERHVGQQSGLLVRPRGEGDSRFAVFRRASDAVAASCAIQLALVRGRSALPEPLRVRIGLYTGETDVRDGDYYGTAVNRCARLRDVAHGGQILVGGLTAGLVRDHLPVGASLRSLGAHQLKDVVEREEIFQLMHAGLVADFPPLRIGDDAKSSRANSVASVAVDAAPVLPLLPLQLTSFIGREHELAEVARLLGTARLITLTGAGGIGKTRLALEVAAEVQHGYADGVGLVELAPLADSALAIQTVAAAVGVHEEPQRPLIEKLVDSLRRRELLLILDNCEHMIQGCAELADRLLRSCPALRILATSREALGIGGEIDWRVPSLSVPPPVRSPKAHVVTESEAVRLFVERAQAALSDFAITEQNAAAIGRLCRRLDGIALALELAAAWVPVLSVEQMVERLDDTLGFLVRGSRTAPVRQQTLRGTLDWSYTLLSESERRLFERLSVFAGGWTLGGAEMVCSGPVLQREAVLDLLAQLVKKSLVLMEPGADGSVRYRLLEPVRQYARERLLEAGAANAVQHRHAVHFLELAELAEVALRGPDQEIWLDRLEREHDNLRSALAWAESVGDAELGLQLAGALSGSWAISGHLGEGLRWLDSAQSHGGGPLSARAKVLNGSGWLALLQGDLSRARKDLQASLSLVRQLHDTEGIVETLKNLGRVGLAESDLDSARPCFAESLALARALGYRWDIAFNLTGLAQVGFLEGDTTKARALFGQGLAAYRALDSPRHVAVTLSNLAAVSLAEGNKADSRALYAEALRVIDDLGDRTALAHIIDGLASLADTLGEAERAQRLRGAAAGLRAATGFALSASEHAWPEPPLGMSRTPLDRDASDAAWAEGHAWSYARALGEAVEDAMRPALP